MNRKGEMDWFIFNLIWITIVGFGLLMVGVAKLDQHNTNKLQKAKCDTMRTTGHTTFLKKLDIFGFDVMDCYIVTSDGKAVPYDRFRDFGSD